MLRRISILIFSAALFCAAPALSVEITHAPPHPLLSDTIHIVLHGCTQGGFLHWGVNARGNEWQQAIPAYRPAGSKLDGIATRTRLEGPDAQGICSVHVGPFNNPAQPVGSVDFAIQWDDKSWDTAGGKDYHIPISQGRISVQPEIPAINDPVIVTVHRSTPGGKLRWGVNAAHGKWQPPDAAYRPPGSTPSEDGLAVDSPLPAPNAAGDSTLILGPFNRAEQVVTSIHMVAHWNGVWDTDMGKNYNVEIRLAPSILFLNPGPGEALQGDVTLALDGDAPVTIWLDGAPQATLLASPLEWTIPSARLKRGRRIAVAHAERNNEALLGRLEFWSIPEISVQPPPPDLRSGAVEHDETVTFALYAPGKHYVTLVGDFNEWDPETDVMNLSPDGAWWWLRKKLPPGTWHYQYALDGELFLADPYAHNVEWKDADGKETHIPSMARTVLEVGAPPFEWTDGIYERPPLSRLLIYELHVQDMHPGGGYTGTIAKLDYIRDLGVNAIEPLPVNEFAGAESWGYNPAFHFAPESSYGTPHELKQLVNEAHRRGLAFVKDVVLNHMDWASPLFQLYGLDYDASPYFHLFLGDNWGFPDLDQQSDAFKRYVADMLRHWIKEYRMDGFRYDATRWTGWQGYNDWGASWFAYAAKKADAGSWQIAEHLPDDPDLINQTEMDTTWDAHFRWRLREMIRDAKLDRKEFTRIMDPLLRGYTNAFQRIAYTESHDEERVMRELKDAGYAEDEAVRRAITALAVTMTAPGVTMVYAGQEFGEDTPKVVGANPLQWEKLETKAGRTIHDSFQKLARLRTTHDALAQESIRFPSEPLPKNVAVYERPAPGGGIIVAVNFGRDEAAVELSLPQGNRWIEALGAGSRAWDGGQIISASLKAGETIVWVSPYD